MKVAVLADDDGEIIAIAHCRMSPTGELGTFTNDADIRAEISRSALDALRGRTYSGDASGDEVITSVTIELPEELHQMDLDDIREGMILDRGGPVPRLTNRTGTSA